MSKRVSIFICVLITAFLAIGAVHAQTGDEQGDVVLHSNPGLAVLVRKSHSYVRLTTPEPVKKPVPQLFEAQFENTVTGPSGIVYHVAKTAYKGKGYRVQVYNGPDRNKAMQVKADIMRRFPGVHTYLTYMAPGFRVKIGDYHNRGDAEGMLREANSMYSPSMIVPDEVTISN